MLEKQMLKETQWITAFVDETGDNGLDMDKLGASNLFICTAIIVDKNQFYIVNEEMKKISNEEFSGGEIKNNKIRKNHKRRIKILERICQFSFGYYALIINKKEIEKDSGLQYKKSFYKYFNRMLYFGILNGGNKLKIIGDTIGSKEFMDSFDNYLKQKGFPDLFNDYKPPDFAKASETPLLQLADLITGTLAWCYDHEKQCDVKKEYRKILQPKQIAITGWPLKTTFQLVNNLNNDFDYIINETCINKVLQFIKEYEKSYDEKRKMQVAVIRHLLFLKTYEDNDIISIHADDLIKHLIGLGFSKLQKQDFSSRIIGKLRDAGIVIAGDNNGYRLATNMNDIDSYINHDITIIKPMIARLIKARESIKLSTTNKYDFLDNQNYGWLKNIVEVFTEHQIKSNL